MSYFYVYGYFEIDCSNPFYIGKGQGNRMWEHFKPTVLHSNDMFHCKLRSMVFNDQKVIVQIIKDNLTEVEAYEYEIQLIFQYGRRDLGTGCLINQSDGGEGRSGFIQSDATREKMAIAMTGKIQPESQIERRRKKNTGKKRSQEIKDKMGEASRKARGQPIESYDLKTGTIVQKYDSIGQAATQNQCSIESIYGCLRGRRRSGLGLGWRYQMNESSSPPMPLDPDSFANQPFEN